MTPARIVFDLDGTLIDSAPDIQGIANALLGEAGKEPISLAQTHDFIGNGVGVFVEKMRKLRGIEDGAQQPLTEAFAARYMTAYARTELYPGVREALTELGRTHRLGICTNKLIAPCHAVLDHLELSHFFDAVLGGDSLPQRKPDPAPLTATFDALGDGPRLYVGDSEVDAETARRADVPFLLFTMGYRKTPVEDLPHAALFNDFAQLTRLVESCLTA